jgi:hypothetical protein
MRVASLCRARPPKRPHSDPATREYASQPEGPRAFPFSPCQPSTLNPFARNRIAEDLIVKVNRAR